MWNNNTQYLLKHVIKVQMRMITQQKIHDIVNKGDKPVVEVARDAQCCVHTREFKLSRTDTQMDGQTLCDKKG